MSRTTLTLLLVMVAGSSGDYAEQLSWTGGPGIQGPVTAFGDCFFSQSCSDWWSFPGNITIAEYSIHAIEAFSSAKQVCASDIDSDGDMDVAAGTPGRVVLWLNDDGAGESWTRVYLGSGCSGGTVSAADMDCDGDTDIVTGDKWFENIDGSGLYWETHPTFNTGTVHSMRTADIDGDDDIDILVANGYTSYIHLFENLDGLGTAWVNRLISVPPNQGSTLFPADIDGDGDCDFLIYTLDDPLYLEFCWMENVNGTGLIWESHNLTQYGYVWDIDAADIDGDGDQDVFTAGYYGVRGFLNSDGAGGSWQGVSLTGSLSMEVETGDMDNDGDLDVVTSQYSTPTSFQWFENTNGSGTVWESHTVNGSFSSSNALCCSDINGDCSADPVICSSSSAFWVSLEQDSALVVSSILDPGYSPDWGCISWNGETPEETSLGIMVRSSADWTQMGEWSGTLFEPASLDSLLEDSTRYFQYAAVMAASGAGDYPMLQDITVTWNTSGIGTWDDDSAVHLPGLSFVSNPCQGAPRAVLCLDEQTETEIVVFDVSGRILQRIGPEILMPGMNQVLLNELSPGVYMVRLILGASSVNQRIVVAR